MTERIRRLPGYYHGLTEIDLKSENLELFLNDAYETLMAKDRTTFMNTAKCQHKYAKITSVNVNRIDAKTPATFCDECFECTPGIKVKYDPLLSRFKIMGLTNFKAIKPNNLAIHGSRHFSKTSRRFP